MGHVTAAQGRHLVGQGIVIRPTQGNAPEDRAPVHRINQPRVDFEQLAYVAERVIRQLPWLALERGLPRLSSSFFNCLLTADWGRAT